MGPLSLVTLCCIFMLAISAARGFKASRPVIRRFTSLRASSFVMSTSSEKYVLVAVADGSEEIETVTIVDTLVRAGAKVVLASVGASLSVTCSRGVKLVADGLIKEYVSRDWDLM